MDLRKHPVALILFVYFYLSGCDWMSYRNTTQFLTQVLISQQRYNHFLIPAKSADQFLDISISFQAYRVIDVDMELELLSVQGQLYIHWVDPFLAWYDNFQTRNVTLRSWFIGKEVVWTPDIVMKDGKIKEIYRSPDKQELVEVKGDGVVMWKRQVVLEMRCRFNGKYFPFDHQSCDAALFYSLFGIQKIFVHLFSAENSPSAFMCGYMKSVEKSGDWELLSYFGLDMVGQRRNVSGLGMWANEATFSFVDYRFLIRRHSQSYILMLWLPALLISLQVVSSVFTPASTMGTRTQRIQVALTGIINLILILPLIYIKESVPAHEGMGLFKRFYTMLLAMQVLAALTGTALIHMQRYVTTDQEPMKTWNYFMKIFPLNTLVGAPLSIIRTDDARRSRVETLQDVRLWKPKTDNKSRIGALKSSLSSASTKERRIFAVCRRWTKYVNTVARDMQTADALAEAKTKWLQCFRILEQVIFYVFIVSYIIIFAYFGYYYLTSDVIREMYPADHLEKFSLCQRM